MSLTLSFLGGAGTVTGSKFVVENGEGRILVDCGLFQGYKTLRLRNWARLPVDPRSIDAVILTHAHLDHTGYLPLLVKHGFAGPIFCSESTAELCAILLPDSGHLQGKDAEYANRHGFSKHKPALPLYTEQEAERVLARLKPVLFHRSIGLPAGASVLLSPRKPERLLNRDYRGSLPWHLDPLEGLQLSDILSLNREFGPLWLLKIGDVALAAVLSRWEGASISPATSPDQMWLGGAWGG